MYQLILDDYCPAIILVLVTLCYSMHTLCYSTRQAISHHLRGAHRMPELRSLLADPGWLEGLLHTYGVQACVESFKRWVCTGTALLWCAFHVLFRLLLTCI